MSTTDTQLNYAQVAALIQSQYAGLLALVRRKLKDRELAADLINEAIAITLEHTRQGRVSDPQHIGGYVFKVSMNLLRNHQRNFDNRLDMRSDLSALQTLAFYDNDDIETRQLRLRTLRVIESLTSARDREVVTRFYLDEQDKETICKDLALSPLQFTQIMSRARKRMRAAFDTLGYKRSDVLSFVL